MVCAEKIVTAPITQTCIKKLGGKPYNQEIFIKLILVIRKKEKMRGTLSQSSHSLLFQHAGIQ